jgi:GntR family transcriptional regulator/MocR family aminotransferase
MIVDTLRRDFADHLDVIPSTVGLHIAATARTASADKIGAIVRRASDAGVVVQQLSRFGVNAPGPPGLVLGYGAIPTARIEDGLQRLRSCFNR